MNKSSLMTATGITVFAIAASGFGCGIATAQSTGAAPASAQTTTPSGMGGSYIGVTVDAHNAFGLGQDWLRYTNNPAGWYVNQALANSQTGSNKATKTTDNHGGVDSRGFQGRVDLVNSPISIRGKLSVSPTTSVVQPIISYDVPLSPNANVYAGAGYTFVTNGNQTTPPANQNAVVFTAGAEAAVSDKVVIYGDAQYRLNNSNLNYKAPVKVQVGVGYRF